METYFLTNSLFRPVQTDFLSSGKGIFFLFKALWKLLNFGGDNSCLWKLILWLGELICFHFSDTPSESYFPSTGNIFWWIFFSTSGNITEISGNSFFGGKTLFSLAERNFLSSENVFLLFRASFLQVKTVTETS